VILDHRHGHVAPAEARAQELELRAQVHGIAAARTDMSVELVDLRDYPMPFFDEPASNAWVPSRTASLS
jgi:hypothetical protein